MPPRVGVHRFGAQKRAPDFPRSRDSRDSHLQAIGRVDGRPPHFGDPLHYRRPMDPALIVAAAMAQPLTSLASSGGRNRVYSPDLACVLADRAVAREFADP